MDNLEEKLRDMEDKMKWISNEDRKKRTQALFEELMMRGFQKS